MKFSRSNSRSGIALIIVMVSIFVLAVLAGGFAYTMKVETKLARNSQYDDQLRWLGRSGVEAARMVLASKQDRVDSLMDLWAGGVGTPMESNSPVAFLELDGWQIGMGNGEVCSFMLNGNRVVVTSIEDGERKFNINVADEPVLEKALILTGSGSQDTSVVIDSILDWIDPDDTKRPNGWESRDYESLPEPYFAKNGPLDDMSELLLINGVTEELYEGPGFDALANPLAARNSALRPPRSGGDSSYGEVQVGLKDLFTCFSNGRINVNTASAVALQVIPGVDSYLASGIVETRAGLDGVDGTYDDVPFQNPGDLINVPGMPREVVETIRSRFGTTTSTFFTVHVTAHMGDAVAKYRALVLRNNPQDVRLLFMEKE